uniref:Uncharacterized protein n=1 Tax=Triticum urartu TaxID=4572 RepID=A0A8R7QIC1_TRIUA
MPRLLLVPPTLHQPPSSPNQGQLNPSRRAGMLSFYTQRPHNQIDKGSDGLMRAAR